MSASCCLAFSIIKGFVQKNLKTTKNKKKKQKIVLLARSKLNSIESKISEALINNEISHEDFVTIINEEKKYRELKEKVNVMNSQTILTQESKKMGINEVINRNEIINNS